MRARTLSPPQGGTPPADSVELGGETVFLAPIAHTIASRHWIEFPDEAARYGPEGFEWCVHDTQYLLWWAALDAGGETGLLDRQVAWLAGVLAARDYPAARLRRSLELAAEALDEGHAAVARGLARALRRTAKTLPRA